MTCTWQALQLWSLDRQVGGHQEKKARDDGAPAAEKRAIRTTDHCWEIVKQGFGGEDRSCRHEGVVVARVAEKDHDDEEEVRRDSEEEG